MYIWNFLIKNQLRNGQGTGKDFLKKVVYDKVRYEEYNRKERKNI